MSFVRAILGRLAEGVAREALVELDAAGAPARTISGGELLDQVGAIRCFLRERGIAPGDRVALDGPTNAAWIAADLAILAEGAVVVPLDQRLDAAGRAAQVQDADPALTLGGSALVDALLRAPVPRDEPPRAVEPSAPATIVYTSGSTGRPRGAVLTRGGMTFILERTSTRLAELTRLPAGRERALHYLPPCYAGSRVMLLSALLRGARTSLLGDPAGLSAALTGTAPHYLLNVPLVLERIRTAARAGISGIGRPVAALLERAEEAWDRIEDGRPRAGDRLLVGAFRGTIGRKVRRKVGPDLRGMVCGSAPLSEATQRFFRLMGVEVYQAYGLTETTALCTLDKEGLVRPGWVGPALPGVELRLSAEGEVETRGPHVFAGYWRDPEASAAVLGPDGWLRTGDLGEVDAVGRWRILGRRSSQLALQSGYKVAPEPIEDALRARLQPAVDRTGECAEVGVLLFGHGRSCLVAVVAGPGLDGPEVDRAIAAENELRPPHQRVRGFHLVAEPFSPENGLLTANLKPRRKEVLARFQAELEALWAPVAAPV